MLRRISAIAASAAVLALGALPASAAATSSSTHSISFPGLSGVKAWGTYAKSGSKVKLDVCAEDTSKSAFAVGAVAVAYNASKSSHIQFGAVSLGYHQTVCRTMGVRYTGHLRVYTFVAGKNGKMAKTSKTKTLY